MRKEYLLRFLGRKRKSIIIRGINKITNYLFLNYLYPKVVLPAIENCFDCEAHREMAACSMRKYKIGKKWKQRINLY